MLITSIITAFILIGIGILSVRKPKIISGYDKLDKKQKELIPLLIKRSSILTGIVVLTGGILSYLFKNDILFLTTFVCPLLMMPLFIFYKLRVIQKNKTIIYFLLLLLLFIPLFLFLSSRESTISIDDHELSISGLYGEKIPLNEIKRISLEENIPHIQLRINGFAFGSVRKGYFLVNGRGKVKLFLSNNQDPYLYIFTHNNEQFIINSKDSIQTIKLYHQLKSLK